MVIHQTPIRHYLPEIWQRNPDNKKAPYPQNNLQVGGFMFTVLEGR